MDVVKKLLRMRHSGPSGFYRLAAPLTAMYDYTSAGAAFSLGSIAHICAHFPRPLGSMARIRAR